MANKERYPIQPPPRRGNKTVEVCREPPGPRVNWSTQVLGCLISQAPRVQITAVHTPPPGHNVFCRISLNRPKVL